jgi:hypothetical protein
MSSNCVYVILRHVLDNSFRVIIGIVFALLFNFALECAIKRVQENQERLKLNDTHPFLSYADDVNIVVENIDTMHKNTHAPLDGSKEAGLEVNP